MSKGTPSPVRFLVRPSTGERYFQRGVFQHFPKFLNSARLLFRNADDDLVDLTLPMRAEKALGHPHHGNVMRPFPPGARIVIKKSDQPFSSASVQIQGQMGGPCAGA